MHALPWVEAGLVRQENEIATLERPTQTNRLIVPSTTVLDGDRLVWHMRSPQRGESWCKLKQPRIGPRGGVLDEFLSLAGKDDRQDVFQFAREWGVFGICEHNLPCTHNQAAGTGGTGAVPDACLPRGSFDDVFWEPVEIWFGMAGLFQRILNIASELHQGKKGKSRDWERVKPMLEAEKKSLREQRYWLGTEVDFLLKLGGVELEFSWRDHPAIVYSTGGLVNLFGYLALQLMLAISRTGGLVNCSNCAGTYIPSRRPNANLRNYCPGCGRKAALRDAARDYRRRQREKRLSG